MNDTELADAVVALGVGYAQEFTGGRRYTLTLNRDHLDAPSWVRSWSVAGALMEKFGNGFDHVLVVDTWEISYATERDAYIVRNKSLPRAIIEACVEALK